MELTLNGTRIGTFFQALVYLSGFPLFTEKQGRTGRFSFDSLNPIPHPEDPANSQCYGLLGCFRVKYPVERGFHLFPQPLALIKPNICLQNIQDRSCQYIEPQSVHSSLLSQGSKSYWIAHGYIDTGHKPWTEKLADELLQYDNTSNIYIIEWGRGAEPPYSQASVNVELLGAYVGYLMTIIQDVHGLPVNQSHFIGHSLGAHFGGFVGSWLNERGYHLGRISGLDPAQPYFQEFQPDARLDPSDAIFVDVIHTDAKPLLAGGKLTGLGTQEPSGHVDFYPNDGKEQPGCSDGVYQAILQEKGSLLYGLRRFFACDHIRSYEIFIESISSTPCLFMGFQCKNWDDFIGGKCFGTCENGSCNRMGFHAKKPIMDAKNETSKIYYALTGSRTPYCREHYRVSLELAQESLYRTNSDLNLLILGQDGVLDKVKLEARDLRDSVSFQYVVPGHGFKGKVEKVVLKPSVANPLWWLVNRVVRNPDLTVTSISLQNLESGTEFILCPDGPPLLRLSEDNTNLILSSAACLTNNTASTIPE